MDRFVRLFQLLVGLVFLNSALAQPVPEGEARPLPPSPPDEAPVGPPGLKERWHTLPPEERERFSKNLQKWEHLSDEEKKRLRERGQQMREQGRKEIEQLLGGLGVELNAAQREEFIKAFLQKRREIERKIREETEPRRKALIAEAVQELKKEFGSKSATTPLAPSPADDASGFEARSDSISVSDFAKNPLVSYYLRIAAFADGYQHSKTTLDTGTVPEDLEIVFDHARKAATDFIGYYEKNRLQIQNKLPFVVALASKLQRSSLLSEAHTSQLDLINKVGSDPSMYLLSPVEISAYCDVLQRNPAR